VAVPRPCREGCRRLTLPGSPWRPNLPAVEGRILQAADVAALRAEATRAAEEGAAAVFLVEGSMGDPIVLAAGLGSSLPGMLVGVRMEQGAAGRHPALLARDMVGLDLVTAGRSVLCFAPPFGASLAEAISVCRGLWGAGEFESEGPLFPVRAAANRARPAGEGHPPVALDRTDGTALPAALVGVADLYLWPGATAPDARRMEWV
jgi:alkanesulfonate monooxygenase SsuD/methylene tetrahydromethanopterin reductase-like flavin-dependent oxidoreductase (luciferase family)